MYEYFDSLSFRILCRLESFNCLFHFKMVCYQRFYIYFLRCDQFQSCSVAKICEKNIFIFNQLQYCMDNPKIFNLLVTISETSKDVYFPCQSIYKWNIYFRFAHSNHDHCSARNSDLYSQPYTLICPGTFQSNSRLLT